MKKNLGDADWRDVTPDPVWDNERQSKGCMSRSSNYMRLKLAGSVQGITRIGIAVAVTFSTGKKCTPLMFELFMHLTKQEGH